MEIQLTFSCEDIGTVSLIFKTMLGSRSGRNGSRERSREKSPLREAEGEKQTTSMGSPVFLIPAMFLVLR